MNIRSGPYPTKTTINLVIKEKSQFHPGRVLPRVLVIAAAVLLFAKFAVVDRLALVSQERAKLNDMLSYNIQLEQQTERYDEVSDQYSRYSAGWMTDAEQALVDRRQVLDLVNGQLVASATVHFFSVTENVVSVYMSGLTLGDTSLIVARLSALDLVEDVDVYTASTQQQPGEETAITMVVTLRRVAEGGGVS